ncbi:MAG: cobalamin-binding protein [bacterium]|nr:cobalamin-binding protein [bacterium]
MTNQQRLTKAILEMNEPGSIALMREMLDAGESAESVMTCFQDALTELGRRYEAGECFIPELMIGGKIMEEAMSVLQPLIETSRTLTPPKGCVVLGTVQHDVHHIGKDIVGMMLRGAGYEVVDLGVNVSPERFVEAALKHKPVMVGLSVLITTAYASVMKTVKALDEANVRNGLKIVVGGAAATDMLAEKTGCDFYGNSATDAINYVRGEN